MDFEPLNGNIILTENKVERKTAGGLSIPSAASDSPLVEGTVVAIGKGQITQNGVEIPVTVNIGEKYLFWKQSSGKATYDGVEYVVVRQSDLVTKVKE